MGKRLKSLLGKLGIALLSLLVTLVLLEAALRLTASNPKTNEVTYEKLIEFDPVLGWRKIPNDTIRNEANEYLVLEQVNAQGLRGPEIPYEKPPGEYRILVVGDSFVEGYYVEFEQLFTEVMAADLKNSPSDAPPQVIAAGTRGYSTDQEYLYYQTEGANFSPDLTILMFYFNDVWNNLQLKEYGIEKPLFEMGPEGELRLTNVPIPAPKTEKSRNAFTLSLRQLQNLRKWLAENSYLYRFIAPRITELSFALHLKTRAARPAPRASGDEEPPGLPAEWGDEILLYQTPESDQVTRGWEMTEALLVRFEAEVRASGSDFLIVFIPRRESVYPQRWAEALDRYGLSEAEWNVEQVRDEFNALCERRAFHCLDLTDPLRAEAERLQSQEQLLYYLEDPHWNAAGNAFVGHFLAEYLQGRYLRP